MVDMSKSSVKASWLEKAIVNWAIVPDAIFYFVRSHYNPGAYEQRTFGEEIRGIWDRRISKYEKLLEVKKRHSGEIPPRVKESCFGSPCDYTRLVLALTRK